ncbi:hypothetical protein SNEBB_001540, partial [Seison nebaliae]
KNLLKTNNDKTHWRDLSLLLTFPSVGLVIRIKKNLREISKNESKLTQKKRKSEGEIETFGYHQLSRDLMISYNVYKDDR